MQTSFLKWKPDIDSAADEYSKAATAFKIAKAYDQTISCYALAASLLTQRGSYFHAAKAIEAASSVHGEHKRYDLVRDLVEKASYMYLENGTPDTAGIALERGGKMLERHLPLDAISLYEKASSTSDGEDKTRHASEMIGRAARLYIRLERYPEATKALRREIDMLSTVNHEGQAFKLVLPLVLLLLHQEDQVAAELEFKASYKYPGFTASEEASAIQELLDSYEQGDSKHCKVVLGQPLFKYMENDFNKLARDLKVPTGLEALRVSGDVEPSTTSEGPITTSDLGEIGSDPADEDDEYADGLM